MYLRAFYDESRSKGKENVRNILRALVKANEESDTYFKKE